MPEFSLDQWTVLVACICAPLKWLTSWSVDINSGITAILNGSTIMPFLALILSVFNDSLLPIDENSKYTMALAGLVGLMFVTGEAISWSLLKQRLSKTKSNSL